jgi:hypothetical protein
VNDALDASLFAGGEQRGRASVMRRVGGIGPASAKNAGAIDDRINAFKMRKPLLWRVYHSQIQRHPLRLRKLPSKIGASRNGDHRMTG